MTRLLAGVPTQRGYDDLPRELSTLHEAGADALADAVHDGALQAMVVARYAADAAVRGGDPALAREAVQEALVALRLLVWELRPRGAHGLCPALHDLAAHLLGAGRAPLLLDLDDDASAALPAAVATAAYRLVQRAAGEQPVAVRLSRTPEGVVLELDTTVADAPAEALRARAVGATLHVHPAGTAFRLPLPRPLCEEVT